ncbi:hypothetical protein DMC47_15975 [Nostoc sp. 3335mG]|nr:hypothetical protein DMC47_15975 [Nostoc sp. 3335mG]
MSGCSDAGSVTNNDAGKRSDRKAPMEQANQTVPDYLKAEFVPTRKKCASDALAQSSCMIQLILEDLDENYDLRYAGGISGIKITLPMTYVVSLPQEERIDLFTYTFERRDGKIGIKSKVMGAEW